MSADFDRAEVVPLVDAQSAVEAAMWHRAAAQRALADAARHEAEATRLTALARRYTPAKPPRHRWFKPKRT